MRARILAVLFASTLVSCDSSISEPTPNANASPANDSRNSTLRISVAVDGDPTLFDDNEFVVIVNASQAIPLTYGSPASVIVSAGEHLIEISTGSSPTVFHYTPRCYPTSPTTQSITVPGRGELSIILRFYCQPLFNSGRVLLTVIPSSGDTRTQIPVTFTWLDLFEVNDDQYSFLIEPNQTTEFVLPPGYYTLTVDSRLCRQVAQPGLFWDAFGLDAMQTVRLTTFLPCT